ncbi:hypothetical protein [Halobacillus sp. B29]|uniref:hypothetical protein n=1 Tax=Halobacillus sp. B29 TaxID=3457432 RepID=UPI003FCE7622
MDGFEFEIENHRTRYFLWIIVIASVETVDLSLTQTAYISMDGLMTYETGLRIGLWSSLFRISHLNLGSREGSSSKVLRGKDGKAQTYYFNTENGSYLLKEAFTYGSTY